MHPSHHNEVLFTLSRQQERVYVQGPGRKHPSPNAVSQLLQKMSDDEDWFPGKVYGSLGGRPPAVSETNKAIIATSAMAMKDRGVDPTYSLIIAQCPNASINSSTGEPVSKQVVYDILESRCYDIDPSIPWSHQKLLAKSAVLPQDMPKRLAFGNYMLSLRHTPHWYWRHVVWTDICNSILPTTIRKANAQALAHTSAEGGCWMDVRGCEARPCQHARQEAGLGPRWEGVFASILDANSCARQAPPRSLGGGLSWRPRHWYVSLRP